MFAAGFRKNNTACERYTAGVGTAVITGASSGIGEAFARALARRGQALLLIARREDRLAALAEELRARHGIRVETLAADLASSGGLARAAEAVGGTADLTLLVNNAGFGTRGYFHEGVLEEQERMHRLHVMAALRLTHAALNVMIPRGEGGVIQVASVAAFARSSYNASYCATKSWMTVFTEGLHLELREMGSRVRVQALCPGFTYSEFHDVLGVDRKTIASWLWMRADEVVEESLRGLERGRWLVIPGRIYRWFATVVSKLPVRLRLAVEARNPQRKARVGGGFVSR
ncbi:MAG: SDR family oxidoreductase [Bryobacterales bacterium]|nr:SDR family oxidoreductase [Bryobacterales bacterium]